MKKEHRLTCALVALLILVSAMAACSTGEVSDPSPESPGSTGDTGSQSSGAGGPGLPDEVEEETETLELLLRMDPAERTRVRTRINELVLREDAMGYYANLYLARLTESDQLDASRYYAKALSLQDTREVRLKLADSHGRNGRPATALHFYAPLLSDAGVLARALELDLAPLFLIEVLRDQSLWHEAILLLDKELTGELVPELRTQLNIHHAVALAGAGRYNDALLVFEMLEAEVQEDPDAVWWYARALEGIGRTQESIVMYRTMGAAGGQRLGGLLEQENRLLEAAQAYMLSTDAGTVWRGTQIAEQMGETRLALEAYLRLLGMEDAQAYQDDAAYRAYILSRRMGLTENLEELLGILSVSPAWMVRIGETPIWKEFTETPFETPVFLTNMVLYEEAGKPEVAALEYSIGIRLTTPEEKLALGVWNQEREDYYRSSIWGTRALTEVNDRQAYELAYPLLYEEEVRKAASEFALDPSLIWAVMKQESAFQPQIRSRAGAVGLMQIMPATGGDIASRLGIASDSINLDDPEMNIRFGAFYLRAMLNQYDGNLDMALAAYNGGPGNVNRWRRSSLMTKAEDFPTAITFFETREYITKVMNNAHAYQWVYAQ